MTVEDRANDPARVPGPRHGECANCGTKEDLIHSGTDAWLAGIPGARTGIACKNCAQKHIDSINSGGKGLTFSGIRNETGEEKGIYKTGCRGCGTTENLIHSGSSAVFLGLPQKRTGQDCINCAAHGLGVPEQAAEGHPKPSEAYMAEFKKKPKDYNQYDEDGEVTGA